MIDYFRDMSHGSLDLNGSKVFPPNEGWYTIPHERSDYNGFDTVIGGNVVGRSALQIWAREAAAAAGDDLSAYFNIVVLTNPSVDLFGGTGGVASGDGRNLVNGMTGLSPSYLGQEMGHGYGLDHARIEGSAQDYMDPFDVMSTAAAQMAPHPVYTETDAQGRPVFLIGPGLTAATMSAMSWLDNTRVWSSGSDRQSTVELRPLHRTDLPGFLCAKVGNLFVEFRMNEGWDAGLADPVVLIHDYFNGNSYLHPADSGQQGLLAGDVYSEGDVSNRPARLHGAGARITVAAIDAAARTARLTVEKWADQRVMAGPGSIFGGVANDGGGWVVVNGKVTIVPPRSPLLRVLEHVSQAQASEAVSHGVARNLIQQQVYTAIAEVATAEAARASSVHVPTMDVLPGRQ
ncbi:hypothetical protein [Arthrobacter sp. V1I7]|uniref:hypothetical protein n=2 Tax=unclassified Arthrobacter TaxID=235627 RepID=UPI0027D77F33|nr:hypothetical protein [Arthrobacter sp. V1I7]